MRFEPLSADSSKNEVRRFRIADEFGKQVFSSIVKDDKGKTLNISDWETFRHAIALTPPGAREIVGL